jgi:hypothetical protein
MTAQLVWLDTAILIKIGGVKPVFCPGTNLLSEMMEIG